MSDSGEETDVYLRAMMALDESGYVMSLEVGEDNARVLTPGDAVRYGAAMLRAVAQAEHDASVVRQSVEMLQIPLEGATAFIAAMRQERPAPDPQDTAPLIFEPSVSTLYEPFIEVWFDGEALWQWDMDEARAHAVEVITGAHRADLDSAYYHMLMGSVNLEKREARLAVADLYLDPASQL